MNATFQIRPIRRPDPSKNWSGNQSFDPASAVHSPCIPLTAQGRDTVAAFAPGASWRVPARFAVFAARPFKARKGAPET